MHDVMLDLETFGTGVHSVIVQIGAVYFDRHTGETGDWVCIQVDPDSELREGFKIDGKTVKWWMHQSEEARMSLFEGEILTSRDAISKINYFMQNAECIWSHATFDFVILMEHMKLIGYNPSFSYRSARDIRTLVDLVGGVDFRKYSRAGVHHNAFGDCLFQIKYVVDCINKLKV